MLLHYTVHVALRLTRAWPKQVCSNGFAETQDFPLLVSLFLVPLSVHVQFPAWPTPLDWQCPPLESALLCFWLERLVIPLVSVLTWWSSALKVLIIMYLTRYYRGFTHSRELHQFQTYLSSQLKLIELWCLESWSKMQRYRLNFQYSTSADESTWWNMWSSVHYRTTKVCPESR